jgi:Ni2+-binding GTPase involved in maturation of urease and hydrogenase
MPPVLLACVGGFLGAGKTTAMAAAARELIARGYKVGLVTNDQGRGLVDTAFFRSLGLPAEEVAGGCFCCRFDELVEKAGRLVEASAADVLLAEAVGSCTDLAATVYRPLRRFFRDRFALAPLSVVVEPDRLDEIEGPASPFPDEVAYIFDRQIAEADLVLLNKIDLLTPPRRLDLERALAGRLRGVPLLGISAATGSGVAAWVDRLLGAGAVGEQDVEVDYEAYARGEAALGWLNATLDARGARAVEPRALGDALLTSLGEGARRQGMPLAHAKVLIASSEGSARVAVTSAAARPQWSGDAALGPARELSVIVNARAGGEPDRLAAMVRAAVASAGTLLDLELSERHFECFRPSPPVPRHRFPATTSER